MSRPVQIVLTLVLFIAIMTGAGMFLKPAVGVTGDWLFAHIGAAWSWALLLVILVPATGYGWGLHYEEGKARRDRSPWD